MSKKNKRLALLLLPPLLYILVAIYYWNFALYQRLTLSEFAIFQLVSGTILIITWNFFNISQLRQVLRALVNFAFVAMLVIQWAIYFFITSIPTGWDNLR